MDINQVKGGVKLCVRILDLFLYKFWDKVTQIPYHDIERESYTCVKMKFHEMIKFSGQEATPFKI